MPLPDERPRASVANLIGKFEQQNKRQSLAGTNAQNRSSSVTSHNTSDSAKEEVKEKREWPPKSIVDDKPPPPIVPSSSWTRSQLAAQSMPPHNDAAAAPPVTESVLPSSSALPRVAPSTVKSPASLQRQSSTGNPALSKPVTVSNSRTPTSPVKIPHAKDPTAPVLKPTSSSARSPPKTSTSSLGPQPLKAQHTGQSTTSASTARKPATKAGAGTPVRPKTPSRSSVGTPKTPSRPKTPSSTSRPKTPSNSNLFAPTAASLAKSRNAPEPKPTPTKKVTLSASAADRLSKPTAASLSKARSPVQPPTSPPRSSKAPAARGGVPTSGTVKPKAGATSAHAKASNGTVAGKEGAVAAAGAVAGATAVNGNSSTNQKEDQVPEGNQDSHVHPYGSMQDAEAVEVHGDHEYEDRSDAVVHDESHATVNESQAEGAGQLNGHHEADITIPISEDPEFLAHGDEGASEATEDTTQHKLEPNPTSNPEQSGPSPSPDATSTTVDTESLERLDEVKTRATVGDDLAEMVSMLESTKSFPVSEEGRTSLDQIPDEEVQEIPDEE